MFYIIVRVCVRSTDGSGGEKKLSASLILHVLWALLRQLEGDTSWSSGPSWLLSAVATEHLSYTSVLFNLLNR